MSPTLSRALGEVRENFSSLNWWRNRIFVPYVVGTATRLNPMWPGYDEAVHVMEEDWDNLVVLDACRGDIFEEVADLEQFDEYRSVVSLGSHSSEWTRRNFADGEYGDTVAITANPHTAKVAGDSFHEIVPLWEHAFDEEAETVLPKDVVKAVREAHAEHPQKRLVVHFMQPHAPFVGTDVTDIDPPNQYWQAYRDTLEHVLEHVHELVADIPGRTVVTADHGELNTGRVLDALGINRHRPKLRHPGLVEVPWAVIDGERRDTTDDSIASADTEAVNDRLRDLGYKV